MKGDIDAIWVLNDNALLNQSTITKAWIPVLKKSNMPVIVGVESLIATKFNLGTYAVVPDHYALGVQGADMLANIMDAGWVVSDVAVEQPLSVKKIINLNISQKRKISILPDKLHRLNKIIR